jgi:hypothetical protein
MEAMHPSKRPIEAIMSPLVYSLMVNPANAKETDIKSILTDHINEKNIKLQPFNASRCRMNKHGFSSFMNVVRVWTYCSSNSNRSIPSPQWQAPAIQKPYRRRDKSQSEGGGWGEYEEAMQL